MLIIIIFSLKAFCTTITDTITKETTLNSTQVFTELPPITPEISSTRIDPIVSAITSLPIVHPSPSNRETNTEDTSIIIGISMMSRLLYIYIYIIYIYIILYYGSI